MAEKLEAMVKLGTANSRMKDFFDVAFLARTFPFSGPVLKSAMSTTFHRRGTVIPAELPVALTESFANDGAKLTQWRAFVCRSGLEGKGGELKEILGELVVFLAPPMIAAAKGDAFVDRWEPGGPWRPV